MRIWVWTTCICALTLAIGLIGILAPGQIQPQRQETTELVPVIFTAPAEPPREIKALDQELPEPAPERIVEPIRVATVVEVEPVRTPLAVAVAVPALFAPIERAQLPPPTATPSSKPPPPQPQPAPSAPEMFTGTGQAGFPTPTYPIEAKRRGYQGIVKLVVQVDEGGSPTRVTLQKSSGFAMLDEPAIHWIKTQWRSQAGAARQFLVPVEFRLK